VSHRADYPIIAVPLADFVPMTPLCPLSLTQKGYYLIIASADKFRMKTRLVLFPPRLLSVAPIFLFLFLKLVFD